MSIAIYDVMAERARQVMEERWTPEHDDQHDGGGMAIAAACYALRGSAPDAYLGVPKRDTPLTEVLWGWTGWARSWFKPKDRRRDLVRAAALLVAEIERLDRIAARSKA